jgi:hypothetical protein
MPQDFHAAFGVGPNDKSISVVDRKRVALAAIQALHAIMEEKDKQIAALESRLAALEELVRRTPFDSGRATP